MPAPVAAATNSISAASTTRSSLAASRVRSTGLSNMDPSGTTLRTLATEHTISSTPTTMAVPR
jgi:hypothetical protein